ncbi:type VII secretion integral membrane protein EccD [Streptomyces triculaminicus]|uniref:type VII secretion integral membrane protein EccD n=1 Tax=Streptomyces triculaminicus TaxID=2816232 RepID=UPI0037CF30DA
MVNVGAKQRTELSRVTLVAERRRVDLVLPADEPIGRLLPDVLRLLDDRVGDHPMSRHLVTAEGTVLSQGGTLADAGVPDGAVLRLVHAEDTPSAPVVHDVTDEVAEDLDVRAWRWGDRARRGTAGLTTVALSVTTALLARAALGPAAVALGVLAAAAVAAVAGAVTARAGGRTVGTVLMLTGGALGLIGAWTAADAHAWSGPVRLAGVAAVVTVTLALLGLFSPLGRGGLIGAGALVAVTAAWEAVALIQHDAARVGAVLAVVGVVALGLLPRLALTAAGMTALDDRRSGGASVSRHQVETALAATHRGLSLATVVVAASAMAGGLLALTAPRVWTVVLAAVLAVVLLSRSRAFPLVAEVVALLAAALVLLVRLAVVWIDHTGGTPYGPLAALGAAAVVPLGVLAVRPPEHVRVRLRRAVDFVETVGVIALFPLAVGAFGVYGRLLHQF